MAKKEVVSHWIFEGKPLLELPEDMPGGFVYRMTCERTGQQYIGKKNCYSRRRLKPLKGKKRHRIVIKESDWKTYSSSSKYVKAMIAEGDTFTHEIILFSPNKTENNYAELVIQVKENVLQELLEDGTRKYLNENIAMRYYASEKHSSFRETL
jgi:hypothetical protein